MAWVRTATSLISFGFTIHKFFQYLQEKNQGREDRIFGPREFAMVMIGIGLVALILATVQHRRDMVRKREVSRYALFVGDSASRFVVDFGIGSFCERCFQTVMKFANVATKL